MNNKAQIHPAIIIVAIILILIITGIVTLPNLFERGYRYIKELQISPENISSYQNVEIEVSILNPHDYTFQAKLLVEFDQSLWTTSNYYIKGGDFINLGRISPNEIKKYSIKFIPTYKFNKNPSQSKFKIQLYDSNNNLIEEREVTSNVK